MNQTENLKTIIERIERQLKAPVAQRDKFERELRKRLGAAWDGELKELMKHVGDPPSLGNVPESYWNNGGKKLRQAITPVLEAVYSSQALRLADSLRLVLDWTLVNQQAVEWASMFSGELITKITDTTRKLVGEYIQKFYTDQWTMDDLINRLSPLFGEQRARVIAITEVTNAATQSEIATIDYFKEQYSLNYDGYWLTANDDKVCEVCGPKHEQLIEDGEYPPAHVQCRCEVRWELKK